MKIGLLDYQVGQRERLLKSQRKRGNMVKKMIVFILCMLSFVFPIETAYSSSFDHLWFQIGDSSVNIKWTFNAEEFYDLKNLYELIALIAYNYDIIAKQNVSISIDCFKKEQGIYVLYDDTNDVSEVSYVDSFEDVRIMLKDKLINYYNLNKHIPDFFVMFRLALPADLDYYYYDYDELEFYYGALPGSMQLIEEGMLYYQYLFFDPKPIINILNQEKTFKGILEKMQINRDNIDQIAPLTKG